MVGAGQAAAYPDEVGVLPSMVVVLDNVILRVEEVDLLSNRSYHHVGVVNHPWVDLDFVENHDNIEMVPFQVLRLFEENRLSLRILSSLEMAFLFLDQVDLRGTLAVLLS